MLGQMHPPPWNPNHRLLDWPDCSLDLACSCGSSVMYPCKLLASRHGNRTFAEVLPRLKCKRCHIVPPEIFLVGGYHRQFGSGGPSPDWSLPLVRPAPGTLLET